jgi:hypothetical protein
VCFVTCCFWLSGAYLFFTLRFVCKFDTERQKSQYHEGEKDSKRVAWQKIILNISIVAAKTSIRDKNLSRTAFIIWEIIRSLLSQELHSKDLPEGYAIARLLPLMRDSLHTEHLVSMRQSV